MIEKARCPFCYQYKSKSNISKHKKICKSNPIRRVKDNTASIVELYEFIRSLEARIGGLEVFLISKGYEV